MARSSMPTPPLSEVYDIAVIGGGINGVGIAADPLDELRARRDAKRTG